MKLALLAVIAVVAAGCGGSGSNGDAGQPTTVGGAIIDLTTVDQLRARFNADAGKPRLIVLASPT